MAELKSRMKDIACLESLWEGDVVRPLSVRPLLELSATLNDRRLAYLSCNTREELRYNLSVLPKRGKFHALYFAFHGGPGEIFLADGAKVPLEELASSMGKRFRGWTIHFSTCGTLDVPPRRIRSFIAQTSVALVMGYDKSVDWAESAAMDLLIFDWLQQYSTGGPLVRRIKRTYPDLARLTGFKAYHPKS